MLYTVFLYNFIVFFSTLLLYIAEREKTLLGRKLCLLLAFLVVTIPSAIRFEIGTDYINYVQIFRYLERGSSLDYLEPGFVLINKVIHTLGLSFEWVFITISTLIHTFAFCSYPKKNRYIYHLFFMLILYLPSFNIMRQVLASTILMYAFKDYFFNKNFIRFTLFVLLASTFHTVALIFLIIPIIDNNLSKKFLFNFSGIIIFLGFAVFIIAPSLIGLINSFLLSSSIFDYSHYLEGLNNTQGLSIFYFTVSAILNFYPFIVTKKLLVANKKYSIVLILLSFHNFFWLLSYSVPIFSRLQGAFSFAIIASIYIIFNNYSIRFSKQYILLYFLVLFYSFNIQTITSHTDYMVTCKPGRLNPYVTIFNKEDSQRGSRIREMLCYK